MDKVHDAQGKQGEDQKVTPEHEPATAEDWLPEGFDPPEPKDRPSPATSEWTAVAASQPAPARPPQQRAAPASRRPAAPPARPATSLPAANPNAPLVINLPSEGGAPGRDASEALKRAKEAAERSEQAIRHANEFEQILSLAEGSWRQSVLDLRERLETAEERVAATEAQIRAAEERARAAEERGRSAEEEIGHHRDQINRENDAVTAGVRALVGRVETIEQGLPALPALRERVAKTETEQSKRLERIEAELPELAALRERVAKAETEQGKRLERIEGDLPALSMLRERIAKLEARLPEITELEDRLDQMKADFADVARRANMGDELAVALSRYGNRPEGEGGGEIKGLDSLNAASFEELRSLGLSVTQAARVIAVRDAQRGFRSAKDIDRIPGLPADMVAELKAAIEG